MEAEFFFERFVSLADKHVIAARVRILPYHRNVKVKIISGINGRMTNSGTQHFHEVETRMHKEKMMEYHTVTGESKIHVLQYSGHRFALNGSPIHPKKTPLIGQRYAAIKTEAEVPAGESFVVDKICTVFTDRDPGAEGEKAWDTCSRGRKKTREYLDAGYDVLKKRSQKEWKTFWNRNDILIRGENDYDQLAIRFALYHLNIKAYRNGYKGAMYPWEAARPEYGETTPERGMADPQTGERTSIYTGKKELHISADISHAVWKYYQATGDEEFMKQWGDEIILATAVFWADRVEWDEDGRVCHIRDVIGPDEYKQRLTDNTYTNYMARNNLRLAVQIAERLEKEDPEYLEELNNRWEICEMLPKIRRAAEGIYLPPVGKDGILPQFAGYGKLQEMDLSYYKSFGKNAAAEIRKEHTVLELESLRVHKQADLVLLLQLFPELPEEAGGTQRRQVREKNYEFYEKHTLHEASYSFATHSLMAASLGRIQEAYALFCQCCDVDLSSDGENAPAGIYAACMGGIWQCVVEGFCGVRIEEDALRIDPCLPETWESVKFRICYRKSTLDIKVTKNALTVNNRSSHPVPLSFRGEEVCLDGTVSRIFPLHSPE